MPLYTDKLPAFRCKNPRPDGAECGQLMSAGHAGERSVPAACPICGPLPRSAFEVLASASHERLVELGLDGAESHDPQKSVSASKTVTRSNEAIAQLEAKKARWAAERDSIVKQVHELDDKVSALRKVDPEDDSHAAQLAHDIITCGQLADDLVNLEWTERDEKALAEHKANVARGGAPLTSSPRSVSASARDRTKAFDRS